nr:HTH-type transcriptional regulator PgrR [Paraburkholderia busanensis]
MDLNACLAFVTVLECGSFSAAARRLRIPRSTVSARVAALEKRLGTRLLRRTTRQIAPTDDGSIYFDQVAPAIRTLREAEFTGASGDKTLHGSIRLSVPLDFPVDVLSQAIASFRTLHARVSFDVIVDNSVSDFVSDNIDLAIRGGNPGSDDFVARQIASFRFGLFVSPAYLQQRERNEENLAQLMFEDPSGKAQALNSATSLQSKSRHAVTANSFALLKQLALDGGGAAFLPAHLCEDEVREERLIEIDQGRSATPEIGLFIVYPSRKDISSRVRKFSEHFVALLEKTASN